MKGGDLVQLSSYGVKRGYNYALTDYGDADQVGLVVEVFQGRNRSFPYRVKWTKMVGRARGMKSGWSSHSRLELKHARG